MRTGSPDHPHACGENVAVVEPDVEADGPSPRVWGKPRRVRERATSSRTIPTRVGKTQKDTTPGTPATDHPHACGENAGEGKGHGTGGGPSPRVWGKPALRPQRPHRRRTIPTRVGKTGAAGEGPPALPDHPHACGENIFEKFPARNRFGPSPRVWGKLALKHSELSEARTIPTRVGKTGNQLGAGYGKSDHPHACGEN